MKDKRQTAATRAACDVAHVRLFSAAAPADMLAVERLVEQGDALYVHDGVEVALRELYETRAPDRKLEGEALGRLALAHAGGDFATYGTWAFFAWSGRLVHILAEADFEELRTSRNRNKITREEQTKLGALRVGVVGLSVGQSTALTLALEGIGGLFRLADFDTLNLSNMNRLRAGVHEIGVNKAVITAREILEINPYARLELFPQGLTDETMDAFFGGPDAPLDLLFEECDDLRMKVLLRQEAKKRRVALLMETSDRGLLDVERFDTEPSRPLFHGLAGELDPAQLAGMSAYEKVPIILAILGAESMSPRLAASLVDVEATLKTWPQLASAVALGGAINADAARRIALGSFEGSGRFYVDLEQLVGDRVDARSDVVPHRDEPAHVPAAAPAPSHPHPHPTALPTVVETLVRHASLAPSGGNAQPWRFVYANGKLRCFHDRERSESFLDFEDRASYMAFGALAENLRLSAAGLRVALRIDAFPRPDEPLLVCEAVLGGQAPTPSAETWRLAAQIELRVTNRKLGPRVPMPAEEVAALHAVAAGTGADLRILTGEDELAELGEILGQGDKLRFLSPVMHQEMMGEMRWTQAETDRTRDGLDVATLELGAVDAAAMKLLRKWSIMDTLGKVGGGHGLAQPSKKALTAASAFGLVTVKLPREGLDRRAIQTAYFDGGAAMQRVWLEANARGWAVQPMTAIVYLFARLDAVTKDDAQGLSPREITELGELRARFRRLLGSRGGKSDVEVFAFRVAKAEPPTARSLRRHVHDILRVEHD